MSEEAIQALTEKRAALMTQIRELQSAVFHIDGAIIALGGRMPNRLRRIFGQGELMRLIGEAERAGHSTIRAIAHHIMTAKKMDVEDAELVNRIRQSVKECRKRMNARGV